jgi:hypothetical protein
MKEITWLDWPDVITNRSGDSIPDFTPANFRYLVDRVNELAEEVRELRAAAGVGKWGGGE